MGLTATAQLVFTSAIARAADGPTSLHLLTVGVKYRFVDHAPVVGALAVLPTAVMPIGTARETDENGGGILLIASRTVGTVALDLNVGYTRRSGDGSKTPVSEALWAAAAGGPLCRRVGWIGELSGSPRTSGPAGRDALVNSLVGVTATLTPSIGVDVATVLPVWGDGSLTVLSGVVWNVGRLWTRRPPVP